MNQLFIEYDHILIGKRQFFSEIYFDKNKNKCRKNAIAVMKYAFSNYLKWSPDAISEKMTRSIMEKLHLQSLMKYIDYPVEYNKETDYFYLAALLYGNRQMTIRDNTIRMFENIINGKRSKYPVDYFLGSDGMVRAGLCLQYVVSNYLYFTSINEIYAYFSCEKGYACLKKYRLISACRDGFETPVDYLHFALPRRQKNLFYYYFYKFKYLREMVTDTGRKRQGVRTFQLEGNNLP